LAVGTAGATGASRPRATHVAHVAAKKLILFELSFPCGLNGYATSLCQGVHAEAKKLGASFAVDVKTGINYADVNAYNSLIQNSMQLQPAGMVLFVNGPAAQTPYINRACASGIKMILIDSPATGLKSGCQASFIGADHYQLGVDDGKWLIANPPANGSKQVGIVALPPGEYQSNDERVAGFTKTIEAAGYKIAATAVGSSGSLATTRANTQNMLTAHPNLGAVFSANGSMGDGVVEALKGNHTIEQLTLDGQTNDVQCIVHACGINADAAQDPYQEGTLAIQYMAKVIGGKAVPKLTYTRSQVIDKSNAAAYLAAGGLH
jgi:ribose transport system substrate-binding protein